MRMQWRAPVLVCKHGQKYTYMDRRLEWTWTEDWCKHEQKCATLHM